MVTKADGESIHLWSSQDALELKMLAKSRKSKTVFDDFTIQRDFDA
ncbi:MAG: hypothetical protein ACJAS1_006089 [Oleiphilaceae bacterium]